MKKLVLLLIILIFLTSCSYIEEIKNDITGKTINKDDTIQQNIKFDFGDIKVYFCPRDNCEEKLINVVKSSEKVNCAVYELNLNDLINSLKEKDSIIVVDNSNYKEIPGLNIKKDDRNALMHNKFCIFDDKTISTGSFNPTVNDNSKNNNNLVIINSQALAENYNDEFKSFLDNRFGNDEKVKFPKIILNNEILIENYFCPEDNCEQHVYDVISKAKKRIYFMTFSFSSDKLGNLIIEKSKQVEVKGIFENLQATAEYSEYNKMKESNLSVIIDKNPNFMHHKVFIVDDMVILGSYNPTSSGNKENDENVLIIYDIPVADKFLNEFNYLWNL